MTTLDNKMHGFQSGDTVTFKEVQGMEGLNGRRCQIEGTPELHVIALTSLYFLFTDTCCCV